MPTKSALLLAAICTGVLPAPALSEEAVTKAQVQDHPLIGEHTVTVISESGLPQPVLLRIYGLEPGSEVLEVTYPPARDCRFKASYGGEIEKGHIFYPVREWSKPCTHFDFKKSHISLKLNGEGNLHYTLSADEGALEEATATSVVAVVR